MSALICLFSYLTDSLYSIVEAATNHCASFVLFGVDHVLSVTPTTWMAVIAVFAIASYFLWWRRDWADYEAEWMRFSYLSAPNEPDHSPVAPHIWNVVHELRSELGLLNYTRANETVVSNRARAIMRSRNMRICDVSIHHPVVIAVYFLRSDQDEMLSRVTASRTYKQHQRLAGPH
jgi:hypothetical protein